MSWFIPIDTGDDITERQPFRQRRSGSVIREGEEEQSGVGLPMRQWLELARADLLNENSGSRLKDECAFFRLHLHRTVKDAEAELGREYDDRLMERPLPLMSLQVSIWYILSCSSLLGLKSASWYNFDEGVIAVTHSYLGTVVPVSS